jgi:hypothetical protein
VNGHDVAILHRMAAPGLGAAVDRHLAVLDEQLGMTTGRGCAGELEKRPQRQGTGDMNVVQLLSLIGMMR